MTELPYEFVTGGVSFPNGTKFRLKHRGTFTYLTVTKGALVVNGEHVGSLSSAALLVTGVSMNGWKVWYCKRPTDQQFIKVETLRNPALARRRRRWGQRSH